MVQRMTHAERSGCPVACALDVFGDHWTLLIVRDLMFSGRHEFKDILVAAERISSNILSDRLKKLEANGIIRSQDHPENRRRKLYYLTQKGKDLVHVLVHMARWAERYLPEGLKIPQERRELLVNDPDRLVTVTLEQLEAWERENLAESEVSG